MENIPFTEKRDTQSKRLEFILSQPFAWYALFQINVILRIEEKMIKVQ